MSYYKQLQLYYSYNHQVPNKESSLGLNHLDIGHTLPKCLFPRKSVVVRGMSEPSGSWESDVKFKLGTSISFAVRMAV